MRLVLAGHVVVHCLPRGTRAGPTTPPGIVRQRDTPSRAKPDGGGAQGDLSQTDQSADFSACSPASSMRPFSRAEFCHVFNKCSAKHSLRLTALDLSETANYCCFALLMIAGSIRIQKDSSLSTYPVPSGALIVFGSYSFPAGSVTLFS